MKRLLVVLACAALAGCASAPAAPSLVDQGYAATQRGDMAAAERLYSQAIRQGDDPSSAWNNLGWVYERTGRLPQALQSYRMAARHGSPVAQKNLVLHGQDVPAPDLIARTNNSSGSGLAELALILSGAALDGYNAGRAAARPPVPAIQPQPAPTVINCTSTRMGTYVNTTCR